ncbi:DUF1398 family protein, partial [Escherichia coli]|uniref:DUF1398 family protein n=6 Tax=Escherichia coli TaxID=562 RepID=UPI00209B99A9
HHAFSSGAGRTSDGNGSHASTLKSPSYTKSVSWQHYPALLHICGKSTFREYCSTLADAGVFRWVTDVNHNKRSYYAIDNTLLYIEDVENNKPLI